MMSPANNQSIIDISMQKLQLLISIVSIDEIESAVSGGADIIDIKNPSEGPLGAHQPFVIREAVSLVRGRCLTSATIGDVPGLAGSAAIAALGAATCGIDYIKGGLANLTSLSMDDAVVVAKAIVTSTRSFNSDCKIVLATYAEIPPSSPAHFTKLPQLAAAAGADCAMIDTSQKGRGRLTEIISCGNLRRFTQECHENGLSVALAGSLQINDLKIIKSSGADVVGVRGAVCEGERTGSNLRADKVANFKWLTMDEKNRGLR